MTGSPEFSVAVFFSETSYSYIKRFVSAEDAVKSFGKAVSSRTARDGVIKRIIITDGGDCTNAEWIFNEGIVYPNEWPR